jgi:hypothetical protein
LDYYSNNFLAASCFCFLRASAKNDFMYSPPNPITAGAPLFFPIIAKVADADQRSGQNILAGLFGGPVTVERKLQEFLEFTQANELILFSDFYRLEDRLRSYEIVAGLFLKPTK